MGMGTLQVTSALDMPFLQLQPYAIKMAFKPHAAGCTKLILAGMPKLESWIPMCSHYQVGRVGAFLAMEPELATTYTQYHDVARGESAHSQQATSSQHGVLILGVCRC